MIDSGDKIKVDQAHLETVIPAQGNSCVIDGHDLFHKIIHLPPRIKFKASDKLIGLKN